MDRFRHLLIVALCFAIAFTGRGPATELASSWTGHDHAMAASHHSHAAPVAQARRAAHADASGTHAHGEGAAPEHSHGAVDLADQDGDSCACGCSMGSCAAMPADLSMSHPLLARIQLRIDLPAPRSAWHAPTPMAPLLRPPIG